jgi:hypothetical protein
LQGDGRDQHVGPKHSGFDLHDDAPVDMGLGAVYCLLCQTCSVGKSLARIEGKDQALDMAIPRV